MCQEFSVKNKMFLCVNNSLLKNEMFDVSIILR